ENDWLVGWVDVSLHDVLLGEFFVLKSNSEEA
ncbi:MAG: hypothetical protein RL418_211, partial [Actinomycetota bacterium]